MRSPPPLSFPGFPRGTRHSPSSRSTRLFLQSPSNPKLGAGTGSVHQKSVKAATSGRQNQWALPSLSTAHQRAFFGACDQSIFIRDATTPRVAAQGRATAARVDIGTRA